MPKAPLAAPITAAEWERLLDKLPAGMPTDPAEFPRLLTKQQRALCDLDPAWGLVAASLDPGTVGRGLRDKPPDEYWRFAPEGARPAPWAYVARILDGYRRGAEEGNAIDILRAVRHCAEENVPLPEWLRTAFRAKFDEATSAQGPQSLDAVFVETAAPKGARRRRQYAVDRQNRAEFYVATSALVAGGMSLDRALAAVLEGGKYPFSKTVARETYLKMHARQKNFLSKRRAIR